MERVTTEHVSGDWGQADAGEIVLLGFAKANHDQRVFEDPAAVNIERKPNRHLAFAAGIHYCLGASLAKLEASLAIGREPEPPCQAQATELADRLRSLRGVRNCKMAMSTTGKDLH